VRTCVVTRTPHAPEDLVRVCVGPEGAACVDVRGKAPGRGAWLLATREVVERAESRPDILRRALDVEHLEVSGLLDAARDGVFRHALDLLSLSSRAGALASGGEQVTEALRGDDVVGILLAVDASARTRSDVLSAARGRPCFDVPLDRDALGQRIGKGPRAAVVLRGSSITRALARELRKLAALR
jgi:predicted RNA-binding protein YlxR (DUF448 family)/ribosomal protein L7Ae-like RNA K-turn-binding protein